MDDVGGGIEEPLQPDAVENGGDEAHFDIDLGWAEGRDVELSSSLALDDA
jgi:hypothetical protein